MFHLFQGDRIYGEHLIKSPAVIWCREFNAATSISASSLGLDVLCLVQVMFQAHFLAADIEPPSFPCVHLYLCESKRKWVQGAASEAHSAGAVQEPTQGDLCCSFSATAGAPMFLVIYSILS